MKVAAVVDSWPRGESVPRGHIVDVLGEPGENDTEMHAILAEYSLPYVSNRKWPMQQTPYPMKSLHRILMPDVISAMC